ncbi:MAG: multiheme c-type cytochrome [Pirellulaceae bacterium]|nr:multiheme c-type cytochrome [Pirellulaceae bacterium]
MKQPLAQPSKQAVVSATHVSGGLRTVQTLIATLVCFASPPIAFAQTNRQLPRDVQQMRPADTVHFAKSSDCALCHSLSQAASAMRDGKNRNVAPFDLWSGSMMANSAVDPYWRAAVSAEVAATPSQKPHIEEVCSRCHAPMAAPIATSPNGEVLAFLRDDHAKAALSKDGVSCTVCHQISSDNLGTDASFTGGFKVNKKSEIYGPHANPVTMPMQRHVGFTPTKADHILSSAMCATCHTVITESFDKQGTATHTHLHEQVPYLEWRNSSFNDEVDSNKATARSCQSCHVPQTDIDGNAISARLAHNPGGRDFPFLNPREPYGRHTFAGGNVFMTQLLRDNRQLLKISTPPEAFDRVIADSRKMLQRDTAKLTIVQHQAESSVSKVSVKIENLSGHKFPTAYPSRRAWLEFVVRDNQGKIVFESGRVNKAGQICDGQRRPIATELAGGPTQPHFDTISNAQQVQIYETFMQDSDGNLTFALLRGSQFKKDNRLLPQGWNNQHARAIATQPIGIENDADFLAGNDSIDYELSLPRGRYKIEVRLLFQSLSSRYVAELLKVDTPEVKSFESFYKKANLTPEVIATQTLTWNIP